MKSQKQIFKASEANGWFDRNKTPHVFIANKENIIVDFLKEIELIPKKVLEIGCSNGFRLNQIREEFHCECFGIDPSSKAIKCGNKKFPNIVLNIGTADELHFENYSFDTIIFGFCLYLCDRRDLFRIAYETDRCLKDKGTVIITDFYPPFPYKNRYSHHKEVFSYKMNYSRMFTWNPSYTEVANVVYSHSGYKLRDIPDERVGTIILRKNEQVAFPLEPFKNNS